LPELEEEEESASNMRRVPELEELEDELVAEEPELLEESAISWANTSATSGCNLP
jgi:hypothetical protein